MVQNRAHLRQATVCQAAAASRIRLYPRADSAKECANTARGGHGQPPTSGSPIQMVRPTAGALAVGGVAIYTPVDAVRRAGGTARTIHGASRPHGAAGTCRARPDRSRGRRLCTRSALALPAAGFLATKTALPLLAATCTAPALMGLVKNEYTVSFGYAAAMAVSAGVALIAGGLPETAVWHAGLITLYGLRLGGFLLWRQLTIDKFRDFVERIEARAPAKRLQRMPFILGCAALYVGLLAPLVLTARYAALCSAESLLASQAFLALGLVGWLVEAVGDYQKSAFKAKFPDRWVDQGLYAFLRHPNYTGEQLLWASSFMAGVICCRPWIADAWPWVLGSFLGLVGIQFVLMQATTGLEKRQQEQYGGKPEFQGYKAGTWAGFTLKRKP